MRPILYQRMPIERLTYEPGHWFFAYYDVQPFSKSMEYHLTHRVDFENRMTVASDVATVGLIRLRDNQFEPVDETLAWNFQQGAMLQWNPGAPDDEILYNMMLGQEFRTRVYNVRTGEVRMLPRPIATVDRMGRFALSINFARIYGFRHGYGYASLPDVFARETAPKEDGVWYMDMKTGETKLILSLYDMVQLSEPYFINHDEEITWKYLVNHITINPDGTRFVALLRGKPDRLNAPWRTYTITANVDGSEPYLLLDDTASHYNWRDPTHIMFYAKTYRDHVFGLYLFRDRTHEFEKLDPKDEMPTDGHCSFSPDGKWILNDTYPQNGYRTMFLHEIATSRTIPLCALAAPFNRRIPAVLPDPDLRTDLHPRWSPDGSQISFDSVHEGSRHVYRIRMEDIEL
ncbi:MAG: hypothetical protein GX929_07570 [Clostridiales bacterium]|nr:hypothetical protein [Clostridiales bacterium]